MLRCFIVSLSLVFLLLMGNYASADILYIVADLGTLGGQNSRALGINNNGWIVGESNLGNGYSHAFVYKNGTMIDLGTLQNYPNSSATDINDNGQIVGGLSTGQGEYRAFLHSDGVMTDLGLERGSASAINSSGQIVGQYRPLGTTATLAFLYDGGSVTGLGTFGGYYTAAYDINDAGQIVGQAEYADCSRSGFLYDSGTMTPLTAFHSASAINNNGSIGGNEKWLTGPFLDKNGTTTLLELSGYDSGCVSSINNLGEAVGTFNDMLGGPPPNCGFVYRDGVVSDLNTLIDPASDWWISDIYDINDSGWIVGTGENGAGNRHAILLIPVPEPSMVMLGAIGLCGMLMTWRPRSKAT